MVRVAYVAAAMAIAAMVDSDGAAAGDAGDAYAQAWFWSFPASESKKEERGPEWFWSFRPFDAREARRAATHILFFAGTDLWRQGAFLYGGTLWAPAELDHDGFVLKLIGSSGYYRYRSGTLGNATVIGTMYAASIMPGLHFTRGDVSVTVYAGLDKQLHFLFPDDPGNAARGRHTGLRTAIDLWYQPTDLTMVAASSTLSTIDSAYAARGAFGWRVLDSFYLGPEALVYGATNYRQLRIGAHITGFDFIWREWQAAIGYAADNDGNNGVYLRLGVSERW